MENLLCTRKDSKQVSNAEAVDRWMGDAVTPDPNDSPPTSAAATNTAVPGYQQADSGTGGSHTNTNTNTNTGTNTGTNSGSGTGSGTGSGGDSGNDNSNNSGSDSPRGADRTSPNTNGSSDSSNPRRVAEPEEGSNLFVAGLAPTVDDAVLFATYARFGAVISAKVMLRVATGVSRGFGFVLFEKAAQAEAAREATHGTAIKDHGGRLQVSVSKHRGENLAAESRVVYLRNVPTPVFEDAARFEAFVAAFGTMERCVLRAGCTSALTHLIVTFDSVAAARKCVAGSHGKTPFPECTVALMAKMEEPQSLREQRLRGSERTLRHNTASANGQRSSSDAMSSGGAGAAAMSPSVMLPGAPSDFRFRAAASGTPPALSSTSFPQTLSQFPQPSNVPLALYGSNGTPMPPPMMPGWPSAANNGMPNNTNSFPHHGPMGFMPPPMPPMPPSNGAPLPPPFGMPFPGMWPGFPPPPMPPMQQASSSSAPAMPPPPSGANYNGWAGGAMPHPGMYQHQQQQQQ